CVTSHNDGTLSTAKFTNVDVDFPYMPGNGDGLYGKYYNNKDLSGDPEVKRVDSQIDFNWGYGDPCWGELSSDHYSVEWTGKVKPYFTETYTFYTKTDDGVKLWVNNQLIIDKWQNQGSTEWSGNIALTADTDYSIKMQYYENSGGADASLSWSSTSQTKEIIPKTQLTSEQPDLIVTGITWSPASPISGDEVTFTATVKNVGSGASPSGVIHSVKFLIDNSQESYSTSYTSSIAKDATANISATGTYSAYAGTYNLKAEVDKDVNGSGELIAEPQEYNNSCSVLFFCSEDPDAVRGLYGEYYDDADLTNLKLTRKDLSVDFDWGYGSPDGSIGSDTYSVRWTGFVRPEYSETYTFYTTTDDGERLWVNGTLLIDKWKNEGATEYSGTIALTADTDYYIRMEYFENDGGAEAALRWSSASQTKQIIPKDYLYVNTYQAEKGIKGGSAVKDTYYVASMQDDGAYNEIVNVDGFSGDENLILSIVYASDYYNGSVKKSLYVNDVYLKQITFPRTYGWETFKTLQEAIKLEPGKTNKIKILTDASNDDDTQGVNLDCYTIIVIESTEYEAENGEWYGTSDTEGGVTYIGSMQWNGAWNKINNVNGALGGEVKLSIRYATNEANSQKSLYVNSTDVKTLTFPYTGGWTTYTTLDVTIDLNAGGNTIMIQNDNGDGDYEGMNIDKYIISKPNLALSKSVTSSSDEGGYPKANAVDGNASTRWASTNSPFSDDESIYVDLGSSQFITRVVLKWEYAHGSEYKIQTSENASDWTDIYHETTGNGGTDDLTLSGKGRYIRMLGIDRGTQYGYSLYEFEIY
ncbi:MAG: discoidin domain-containing protein, partial [Spirochaetes bacterium]|nr:discoidin domain-containing protein [Spirochaetota bacterium]